MRPKSGAMDPFQREAKDRLNYLIQGVVRRTLFILAGLHGVIWWLQLSRVPQADVRLLAPVAALGGIAMVAMGLWMGSPRPPAQVNALGGCLALLFALPALLQLALSGNLSQTIHLILIETAAGFFLLSPLWFTLTSVLIGAGWLAILGFLHPKGDPFPYGLGLAFSALMGLLFQKARGWLVAEMVKLKALGMRRESELQEAAESIRTLRGLIPICACCKKVRDDQGFWQQVEVFVERHSHAAFSHGYCPPCLELARAEWEQERDDLDPLPEDAPA